MPEGDTVHRVARRLGPALTGRTVDRLELRDQGAVAALAGRRIEGVEARGKHMLIHFEGGWSLRVHLGMHGRWVRRHVRQPQPARPALRIVVGDTAFTCERAYRVETVRSAALRSHPKLARLGPDLLADPPDLEGAVRRARAPAHRGREIGDVLLDQRVAAGIGNVYKSEVLFAVRVHPRTTVGELGTETLRALFDTAARFMRQNLGTRRRTTVPLRRRPRPDSDRLWVYGRAGRPCLECGTPIRRFLQGDAGRSTYVCPVCQRSAPASTPDA